MANNMGFDLTRYLGLFYFQSEYFQPYQYITHMFMHGGFSHILFNMFAFWMFGTVIEEVWGSKRFLIYFLVTGLGAAGLHTLVNYISIHELQQAYIAYKNAPSPESFSVLISNHFPEYKEMIYGFTSEWSKNLSNPDYLNETYSFIEQRITAQINIPTVGASGAVFGLLLAFGMMFPNSLIYIYFAIPIKAKYFVMIYGAIELYSGFANQPGDNVAHFAHLGGMIFGFLLIKLWQRKRFN